MEIPVILKGYTSPVLPVKDFVRQAHIRIFLSYDLLLQNHGRLRSGPKAVCLDMPKREYIDVLAGPVPSGLQARPKTENYQCYRARPTSEYHLSTRPDLKPHIICATRPDPNPNFIRATSQTRI